MQSKARVLPPAANIIITLIAVFIGMQFIGPFFGFFIAVPFYPGPLETMLKDLQDMYNHPELKTTLMILQGAGEILGLILLPAYLLHRQGTGSIDFFKRPFYAQAAILTIFITLSFVIADSPIAVWNESMHFPEWMSSFETWARGWEDSLKRATEYVTAFDSPGAFALAFVFIAVVPAIGEELVFRGIIQREFYRGTGNIHVAIWISAAIFSAFHVQFFGFFPRMFLGVVFGYLYYWSDSLIIPIIAHFFNNGFIVIALYLHQRDIIETNPEENTAAPWSMLLFSVVLFGVLLYAFKKFYRDHPRYMDVKPVENPVDNGSSEDVIDNG